MQYIKWLNNDEIEFKEFDTSFQLENLLNRSQIKSQGNIRQTVEDIEKYILFHWDDAIRNLTKNYDWVKLKNFLVTKQEIEEADNRLNSELKIAILIAKNNIENFHKRQLPENLEPKETSTWINCWREFRAIENVGLYIPWGTASLFSTVLMLWIPATIVWCKNIIICSPVNREWKISDEILYTASLLWINKIYKIWGAQAIFAMAYWTEQVPKVDKIFWPWNAYVTEAKLRVSQFCPIDMPAWPSEVLVIADKDTNANFAAADLLSQAEHWKDSQSVLISDTREKIVEILDKCKSQLANLPRKDIAKSSLENSFAILVNDMEQAVKISNQYAPEHLILHCKKWWELISQIINAWSVFCWEFTPESIWDYSSWTNHTLPTNWFAKSYSWVWLESFWKWITFQHATKQWLSFIQNTTEIIASKEWLYWHKNAVTIRI